MTGPPPPTADRSLRVFISSTFHDMQAEREELVKRVFPRLRKICEERGVTWGEIDLRWGITEEQAQRGEVLHVCLAEIDRCRPYFLGILGERYGWVPDRVGQELLVPWPWLAEYRGRSVTELEVLHGALLQPRPADPAFFYFRDPAYVDALPPAERQAFRDGPSADEISRLGATQAQRRAAERRERLAALKERIRRSGLPVHEGFPTPRELGELIFRDLKSVIDRLFPEGTQPDPLTRETAEHEAFARSRARVYVGRPEYFARLDAHAEGSGPPLIILGESGAGKSALLANWALHYRAAHPDRPPILHFVGATPFSADWVAMLRRLVAELGRRAGVVPEIPDRPDALRAAFASVLLRAADRGAVVLVLDALNQLEDRDGAPDLVWLPPELPAGVRLIVSTLPGRPLEALTQWGWPTLTVEPLRVEERRLLIRNYLARHAKALDQPRAERLAVAARTANPLYLRALLDELRLFGIHERLDDRIDHYLAAPTIGALYERILQRYEQDYERDRPGLVREALTLLWAARRGLSEAELLDVLGTDGEPLPGAYWSPLFLAAESGLLSRSGLLGFAHDYLRAAVRQRYLAEPEQERAAHLRLADYFAGRGVERRAVEELPWQLARAGSWQRLADLWTRLPFFTAAWDANRFDVLASWSSIEAASDLRMVDAYRPLVAGPERGGEDVWDVALLLHDAGHPREALPLLAWLIARYERTGDRKMLAGALSNQALILRNQGDLDGALALHQRQEAICRDLGDEKGLQGALGNRALVLKTRGDLADALALFREQEAICRRLGDEEGLQASLGNQAMILYEQGDLSGALALQRQQERICRGLGHRDALLISLCNQGVTLQALGDMDGAMRQFEQQEELCQELGNRQGLRAALGNQALVWYHRGEPARALALMAEEERISRQLGLTEELQSALGTQAAVHIALGHLEQAETLLAQQEEICRAHGYRLPLVGCLNNRAMLLEQRGEFAAALALYEQNERVCRELGTPKDLAIALANRADTLAEKLGRAEEALPLAEEAERLVQQHGLASLAPQIESVLESVRRACAEKAASG
jgi:tetratricopeptide (TPR) repeat protein